MAKAVREKWAKKTILNVFLLISGTFNLTSTVLAILIFSLTGEIYSGLSFICDLCGNMFCHKNNVLLHLVLLHEYWGHTAPIFPANLCKHYYNNEVTILPHISYHIYVQLTFSLNCHLINWLYKIKIKWAIFFLFNFLPSL